MEIYRLSPAIFSDDLSGVGAKINGGRWNSIGNGVVYCSENRSLSILEYIAHLDFPYSRTDLQIITLQLSLTENINEIKVENLPKNWNKYPVSSELQRIGDKWVNKGESLVLKVPSVLVPDESNYLINPLHPLSSNVKIMDKISYIIDERLYKKNYTH